MATRRISGSVIRNAAVDFRFSAAWRLERLRVGRAPAALFGCNTTSAIMRLPRQFHSRCAAGHHGSEDRSRPPLLIRTDVEQLRANIAAAIHRYMTAATA